MSVRSAGSWPTRGIDHAIALAVALDNRVDGIARGAGDIAHDGAVIADHLVEERGLAGVRSADDGDTQRIGLVVLVARVLGQQGDDLVEQVAGAVAVQGGDGDGVTHAQGVELPKAVVLTGGIVELVDEQESRFLELAHHAGDALLLLGDTDRTVDHKQDDSGFLGGGQGLVADGRGKDRARTCRRSVGR